MKIQMKQFHLTQQIPDWNLMKMQKGPDNRVQHFAVNRYVELEHHGNIGNHQQNHKHRPRLMK
jgi:hypothetical protein